MLPSVSPIQAIKFAMSDRDWKTTALIGAVMMLIPIAGPIALMGFFCEVHQRLVRRDPRPVPKLEFADLSHYIGRGVVPFVVQLIVALPLSFLIVFLAMLGGAGAGAATAARIDPAILVGVGIAAGLVTIATSLLLGVVINAAQTRAELTEDFGQSLVFGKLMAYSGATWPTVMIKVFVYGFLAMLVTFAGLLLLCVGVYPAAFLVQLGQVHLRWQIYERFRATGGEEIPVKAPVALPSAVQPQYGIG